MTCDALSTGLAADARVAARRVCRERRVEGRADDGAKRERVADADIPAGHADRNDDPLMTPSQKKKRHDDEENGDRPDDAVSRALVSSRVRVTRTRVDDEPCDYQKAGSCLVPGAVESDRDLTCSIKVARE